MDFDIRRLEKGKEGGWEGENTMVDKTSGYIVTLSSRRMDLASDSFSGLWFEKLRACMCCACVRCEGSRASKIARTASVPS